MIGPAGERWFTAQDISPLPSAAWGVYCREQDGRVRLLRGRVARRADGGARGLVQLALVIASRPGLTAVTLRLPAQRAERCGLALEFCQHLRVVRARRGQEGIWVTSPARPPLPSGEATRVPHLVTYVAGSTRDVVVWEVMPTEQACRWLGGELPDASFEKRLPGLLRLRRRAREGRLPDTAEGRAVGTLLERRYMSMRLVYEHAELFAALAEDATVDQREET